MLNFTNAGGSLSERLITVFVVVLIGAATYAGLQGSPQSYSYTTNYSQSSNSSTDNQAFPTPEPQSSESSPAASSSNSSAPTFDAHGKLEPTVPGGTQCSVGSLGDGSGYAQVAISGGATCDVAESVIKGASGSNGEGYASNGYTCAATKQGSGTKWSSYWNNNFYSYTCSKGSAQVAFNWQSKAQRNSSLGATN
jgi:hypothetical protein